MLKNPKYIPYQLILVIRSARVDLLCQVCLCLPTCLDVTLSHIKYQNEQFVVRQLKQIYNKTTTRHVFRLYRQLKNTSLQS